ETGAADGTRRMARSLPALLVQAPGRAGAPPGANGKTAHFKRTEEMITREQYKPGPATGAEVRKNGDEWTLVLVRDFAQAPALVWKALTDPAELREWAPFESDRDLGSVGTATLTTVGAPQVQQSHIKRAEPGKVLEFDWGGQNIRWE